MYEDLCMYVKCMEMFLFGGIRVFGLQTDKIMNTCIISTTESR